MRKIKVVSHNQGEYKIVPLNKIKLSRNSRLQYKEVDLAWLMSSMKSIGLLQPIGLVTRGQGYEIAFGNCRYLAASRLGWLSIPAIVGKEVREFDVDLKNLAENIVRKNPSYLEIGRYVLELQKNGLSVKECAVRVGMSYSYLRNAVMAFQRVPAEFRDKISPTGTSRMKAGEISIGQLNAVMALREEVTTAERKQLLSAAEQHGAKFKPEHVVHYVENLRKSKEPLKDVIERKSLNITFDLLAPEIDRLESKYVIQGPFRSISQLCRAILKGEIAERVKLIERFKPK